MSKKELNLYQAAVTRAQKEVPCNHCANNATRRFCEKCYADAAPPPSDVTPVVWPVWLDPKDDPLVLRNMAKVGYTFDEADCDFLLNLAKNIELDFAAHPEDAPGGPWIDFCDFEPHPDGMTIGATVEVVSGLFAEQEGKIVEVDYGTRKARFELDPNRLRGETDG